jgi:hypothetical protein
MKSGSLNIQEPSGPVQACTGLLYFYYIQVSGQPDALATFTQRKLPALFEQEAEWAPRNGPTFGAANKLLLLVGCEHRLTQPVA